MRIFDEIKIGLAQATALLEVKNRLSSKEMAELEEIIKEKNLCELINKNNLLEELSLKLGYVDIDKEKFEQKINYITAASTMPIDEIRARLSEYDKSSPKEDEVKMISELSKKYQQKKSVIIRRIKEVRRIDAYNNFVKS